MEFFGLGKASEVSKLIKNGANVNFKYNDGETPLLLASISGNHRVNNNEFFKIEYSENSEH